MRQEGRGCEPELIHWKIKGAGESLGAAVSSRRADTVCDIMFGSLPPSVWVGGRMPPLLCLVRRADRIALRRSDGGKVPPD